MERIYYIGQPNRITTKYRSVSQSNVKSRLFNVYEPKANRCECSNLRSKRVGSFAFVVDNLQALDEVVCYASNNGLTVAGDNSIRAGYRSSILNATLGDIVTVGVSSSFDVDWIRGGCGVSQDIPLYRLNSDFDVVARALNSLINEKNDLKRELYRPAAQTFRELKLSKLEPKQCGCVNLSSGSYNEIITVTDQYVKIGYTFIPYNPNTDILENILDSYIR